MYFLVQINGKINVLSRVSLSSTHWWKVLFVLNSWQKTEVEDILPNIKEINEQLKRWIAFTALKKQRDVWTVNFTWHRLNRDRMEQLGSSHS